MGALAAFWISWIGLLIWYSVRHPCLEYATRRVRVPETTIYIQTGTGVPMGPVDSEGMPAVPITTPAHWEDVQTCVKYK